ncbi:MAG: hypothetical protein U0841_28030 [Chloroflexia bacterium]
MTVYASRRAVGTATLGAAPQEYRFVAPFGVGQWGDDPKRMLNIETSAAYLPPGDPRPLGPIVAQIAVAPVGGGTVWPIVLGAALVLLAGLYALLRLLELRPAYAAGFVGLGMAGWNRRAVRPQRRARARLSPGHAAARVPRPAGGHGRPAAAGRGGDDALRGGCASDRGSGWGACG